MNNVVQQADVIFVGIRCLTQQSPIFKDGFITLAQLEIRLQQAAVGEIRGHVINANGGIVKSDINTLITSYDIRRSPCSRSVTAVGEDKHPAILSALKGQWINGLATDEHTARGLLTH